MANLLEILYLLLRSIKLRFQICYIRFQILHLRLRLCQLGFRHRFLACRLVKLKLQLFDVIAQRARRAKIQEGLEPVGKGLPHVS